VAIGVTGEWPAEGLVSVVACPVCCGRSRELLYADLQDRVYLCAPGRWSLYRCASCASAYLDPRPSDETVGLAYATYYAYGDEDEQEPSWAPASRLRRFRRALRNGYVNARFNYLLAPSLSLGRVVLPLLPRRREEADISVRHLCRESESPRLLDVGCGAGEFLAEMQAAGWRVDGVEPNPIAADLARRRGIPVFERPIGDATLPEGSFDAITFRLVLEHLPNPVQTLSACFRILRPGGLVWVATPNLASEGHRVFGRDWIFLDPPRHAVLLTPASLTLALERSGFEVVTHRPERRAGWTFEKSSAIAAGDPPFGARTRASSGVRWQARLADARSRWRPARAECAILIARKPPAAGRAQR
jgi:SAM-dependent methyltransferase